MRSPRPEPLETIEWIDGVPTAQSEESAPAHTEARTIESRSNWVADRLSDQRAHRFVAVAPSSNEVDGKPVEQVLQATKRSPTEVVAFLNEGVSAGRFGRKLTIARGSAQIQTANVGSPKCGENAALTDGVNSAGLRNEVLFSGRLASIYPPLRRVAVRVYPSASNNLTILEVLPSRAFPGSTHLFLSAGVAAITELTDRIERIGSGP